MTPDTLTTIVVLFEGVKIRGVARLPLLTIVALKYDEVALRSVQNSPAVVGTVPGSVMFENPEFERKKNHPADPVVRVREVAETV